jgi:hypothetical protein
MKSLSFFTRVIWLTRRFARPFEHPARRLPANDGLHALIGRATFRLHRSAGFRTL